MVTRTFIDKSTTIVKDKFSNYGLHPISMIHFGKNVSRFLIHFDVDTIKKKTEGYKDVKHILRMTNCGSVNIKDFDKKMPSFFGEVYKKRATSFVVIAFRIPQEWHRGIGFDHKSSYMIVGEPSTSLEACNWYQSYNGFEWEEEGMYSTDTLSKEYAKFSVNEESIIVDRQVFEYGNENLQIDVTKYVNDVISGAIENYGIGFAVTPLYEDEKKEMTNYVGFFNEKTNTFFAPVIESRTDDVIADDRYNFYLSKKNRLYLYANIEGEPIKLDKLPVCKIDGKEYEVTEQSKGVYFAEVNLSKDEFEPDTILYDEWSNLYLDGEEIDDVEMSFVTKSNKGYVTFNTAVSDDKKCTVTLTGINEDEKLIQGDERMVKVIYRIKYTDSDVKTFNKAYYRLYVKDGEREIDVIDWDVINQSYNYNFFMIKTDELLPNKYHIDVKTKMGMENRLFKDVLEFKIVNNPTNEKR